MATETDKELRALILKIDNEKNFISGVFSSTPTQELRKELCEYIKQHPQILSGQVLLYSLLRRRGDEIPDIEEKVKEIWPEGIK